MAKLESATIGTNVTNNSPNGIAIGNDATTLNSGMPSSIAIGYKAMSSNNRSTAIGNEADAAGFDSVALGTRASNTINNTIAIGTDSSATGATNIAIGQQASAGLIRGRDFDSVNLQAGDTKVYYKKVEKPADATEDTWKQGEDYDVLKDNVYYKKLNSSVTSASYAIALGVKAKSNSTSSIAIGGSADASAAYAMALGNSSSASADTAIALGRNSNAGSVTSIALGYLTNVNNTATSGVAIGRQASVTANYGLALGYGASVANASAIALGANSTVASDDGNVLSIGTTGGERKIIHVAAGKANTDAANYGQLIAKDTYTLTKQGTTNIYSATLKLNSDTGTAANGPTIQIDASDFGGGSGSVSNTVTQGDTNAVSGGAVYTEVRPADGTYVKRNQTTAENLTKLDGQVKTNAGNITTNAGDISGLKNMSNLSSDGVNKVKEYAQDAVKVEADSAHKGLTVTADTTKPNQTTYKVALDKNTIGGEVGIGKVENNDNHLVTGNTVYQALQDKVGEGQDGTYINKDATVNANLKALDDQVKTNADNISKLQDMEGLTDKGVKNLKGYAQEAVTVTGDGDNGGTGFIKVEAKQNENGTNTTYKVSLDTAALKNNIGNGEVAEGDTGLVTGGKVYQALQDKLGDGQDGTYIDKDATVNTNLKALDDAIGEKYDSTNNITEDDNVKTAVGKLDTAMGQVSSLNGIKGLDNQAIGSDTKPTNVSAAVLAVDGKVGNLNPDAKYNVLGGEESLAKNLEKVDAALGDVNSLYGTDAIKDKNGDAVSKDKGLAGVMKAMDGKIGDLKKDGNYITKGNSLSANLAAVDAKMGKLTENGNTIKVDNTVAQNFSALDTAMGDVKKLNAIKDKEGNAIGSDDKATNVADAVVAVDGKVGDLEKDGNYITKGNSLSANLTAVDAKMGKLTEDGDYVKIDNDFATNFSALDKGLGKLEKDGNLVKKDNSAAANIAIIDTAIGSKDDYGTGYNISTGDDVSLKKNIGALDAAIGTTADGAFVSSGNSVGQNLNALDKGLSDLGNRVNKVGAGAAALAALHVQDFDPDNKLNFAVGFGHYKNANSGAIGAFYKPNHDTTFSIASTIGNGDNMLNAGISFKLGKSSHVEKTMVVKADYEALQQKVAAQDELLAAQNERLSNQDAQIEELKKQVAALIARG